MTYALRAEARQFLAFCVAGGVGFVVDATVLQGLVKLLGWSPYAARPLSFLVAVGCTWLINRNAAFRAGAGQRALHREGALYLAVQTAGAGLNYVVFCALLWATPAKDSWAMLGALAFASGIAMVFNYFAMRRLVFSPRSKGLA